MQIEFLRPDRSLSRQQAHVEQYQNWDQIAEPYPAARWQLVIGQSDDQQWAETRKQLKDHGMNAYKNLWHEKKSFE